VLRRRLQDQRDPVDDALSASQSQSQLERCGALPLAAEQRIDIAVGERSETHGIKKVRAGGREKDSLEHGSRSSSQHVAR
jgi:hypothetical protein